MFKHVLLPTDGSQLSGDAIRMGVQLAKAVNAKVTGLYVMPEFHVFTYKTEMLEDTYGLNIVMQDPTLAYRKLSFVYGVDALPVTLG